MKILFFLTLMFVSAFSVDAHYLWIELGSPAKLGQVQEVRIFYGEFNEGVREVRGGRLDELAGVTAWLITPDGKQLPLVLTTEEKFFKTTFVPATAGKYTIVAVNNVRGVVDWSASGIGVVRPTYYTYREIVVVQDQSTAAQFPSEAMLRISPAKEKNSFAVQFNGKPLSKAKVFFHAPNEWSKELSTDEKGIVTFNPLWKGQYIVECIYLEKGAGSFNGKSFEAIRHRATLSMDVQ
ncbi:DUF4198 domain-containing protein [Pseudochryseolinea flava]|uniref:DUF4198 domain-containing protein n=1 Tax=Pseudochryseolinea flava TaxID=2059302 RepID=A0A364Y6P3_9BACT|nr:DUF4198 domain-containing protein [Pseudochryseolinea flava]RAW02077.1 hypothetical protein DQQ10_05870 [Pseudochryseolinea flava]